MGSRVPVFDSAIRAPEYKSRFCVILAHPPAYNRAKSRVKMAEIYSGACINMVGVP